MDFIKINAKSIIAFVVGILGNMAVDLASGKAPIPQTTQEWMRYLIFSFGSAAAVYGTRNKLTVDQVANGLPQMGQAAAGAIAVAVPHMIDNVQEQVAGAVLGALPKPVRDVVGTYPFWNR